MLLVMVSDLSDYSGLNFHFNRTEMVAKTDTFQTRSIV